MWYEGARSDQCDNVAMCLNLKNCLIRVRKLMIPPLSCAKPNISIWIYRNWSLLSRIFCGSAVPICAIQFWVNRYGKIESEGLKPRSITRDLDWGIPVPVEGWDGKCLYVWFEAVIGYLSAPGEWSQIVGKPEAWRDWWTNPDSKAFYFIGKDNIFFHTALWPAELMGAGEKFMEIFAEESGQPLTLPYDVPANQFMNMESKKISGSRNWAVWGRDFLTRYDPDPLRYYLTINMPENRDTDWSWSDFHARNNNELLANWGNLANRVLSFAYKHWEGVVPNPGELREQDQEIIAKIEAGFERVGNLLATVKLRAALSEAMRLASEANKYLDTQAPWFEIKSDKDEAAKTIYTAMRVIDFLKVLLAPFIPFTSEQLNSYLGYENPLFGEQVVETISDTLGDHTVLRYLPDQASGRWEPSQLQPGQAFQKPAPLFKKLDVSIIEEERARMG